MNKVRILLACLWVSVLLVGCNDKPAESTLENKWYASVNEGDVKSYWVQSYSTISNIAGDWTDNDGTFVTKALLRYNIRTVNDKGIIYQVFTDYLEVSLRNQPVKVSKDLQTLFADGLTYQLSPGSNQVLAVSPKNIALQQKVLVDKENRREYLHLKSTIITPFMPVSSIPVRKGEKLELHQLFKMENLSIYLDKVMGDEVALVLKGSSAGNNRLYGKAVLQKNTGVLLRLALVREVMVGNSLEYKMRTFLLIGPPEWSSHPDYQLITLANQADNEAMYKQLQELPVFNTTHWQDTINKELATDSTQGKIYTLTPSSHHSKLLLSYQNTTGTDACFSGDYQLKDIELFDKENKPVNLPLLPFYSFDYKRVAKIDDEAFVASYRPLVGDTKELGDIYTLKAQLNFTPYALESSVLSVDSTQPQKIQIEGFAADLSPTNDPNTFVLHWHAKADVVFSEKLIDAGKNVLFQYIQPDAIEWLLPVESQAISWLVDGSEHYMKLTFKEVPKQLKLYPLRKTNKPAFTHAVNFSR